MPLAIAVALPLLLAAFVATQYVDVPMYDEWIWSPLVLALHDGALKFSDLWAPQGAHRSLVPTALALGLAHFDGWSMRDEALVSVALAALTQALLWYLLRRRSASARAAALPFCVASLLLYSLVQSENWLWGFQLSWLLVNLATVAVVALLDAPSAGPLRFSGAVAAALIASFSLVFGCGAWFAGAVMFATRREWWRAAIWLGCAAVASAAFAYGYALPHDEHGWASGAASPLLDAAQFVLAYLGAPLGIAGGRWTSELLGTVLLLAGAALLIEAWRAGRDVAAWTALLAFALLAGVMEAVGRAGNGVDGALAFRYTTPASLAWIALVGLTAQRVATAALLRWGRAAWVVGGLLFVSANAAGAFEATQLIGMQHAAADAFRDLSAHDDEELAQYENDPAWLRAQARRLQLARLGPWRDPHFSVPGSSTRTSSADPRDCAQ